MVLDELGEAVDEVFTASPSITLAAMLLPGGRTERRLRIALHLILESAADIAQLLGALDALGIHLCQHDDSVTGSALLDLADRIREAVA
jgi:hypothetical protein